MTTLLASIFVFGLLIASHEFGHFIVAKSSGVAVLEFSIGMGPKILGFRKGETDYSLRLLPIGGYVKMLGEDGESTDPRAFCNQSPWRRLPIILAGAIMNFLIAILLFSVANSITGFPSQVIGNIEAGLPAEAAGFKVNDKIIKVNDKKVNTWNDFLMYMDENKDKEFKLTVERDGKTFSNTLKPIYDKENGRYRVGIGATIVKSGHIGAAFKQSFVETTSSIKMMVSWIGKAVTGGASLNDVGGPVAIVQMSGQAARAGVATLLSFAGFLSINLGVINLLPFPALDGGWVIILLIEGITRRKIDENKIGFVNMIGFTLLMIFAGIVILKDLKII